MSSLRTLKVENNDFVLKNGRLIVLTDIDALAQILENRLKLWVDEWFITPLSGIDYLGLFNQKVFLEARYRIIVRNAILADPSVNKITSLDIGLDNKTREISATLNVESVFGSLVVTATT